MKDTITNQNGQLRSVTGKGVAAFRLRAIILDAVEKMEERIAALEAERARKKQINAAIKKGEGWEQRLAAAGVPLTDAERADLVSLARAWAGVYKPGYPPYAFQNLSGNISRQKKRLEELKGRAAARARVDAVLERESGLTKLALRRDDSIPVGEAAPLHVVCTCGQPIPIAPFDDDPCGDRVYTCQTCGLAVDGGGWIVKRGQEARQA